MKTFSQLASNQQDIWHDQHAHPKSPLYNIGGTLIIDGKVNYKFLNRAIRQLIEENDALRISISNRLSTKQQLHKKIHFNLELIDFSHDLAPKDKANQWLNNSFQQPFNFNNNKLLWHFALIKEGKYRYYLMTKFHHLIADGWSTTVVIARLAEIYNALLYKKTIPEKTTLKYFDFIKQEQEYLNSSRYLTDKHYWESVLPTAPETLISRRYPLSCNTLLPKALCHKFTVNRKLFNSIDQFSVNNKGTSYQTLLTALAIYFSRIYQREDIVIGVPSLNRQGSKFKQVFGLFISLSPLVLNITQSQTSSQLLNHCTSRLRDLYRHQRFPLNDINKRLKLLRNGRDTLFDIVLSYEKHQYSSNYGPARIRAKQLFSGVARYPLAVTICDFNDKDDIEIFFEGAENCFTVEDLQFIAERFLSILQQICHSPEIPVNEINLLTTSDTSIIFHQFNKPGNQKKPPQSSVIQLFQYQVKKQPEHIAIEFKETKMSYSQLDSLSNELAQYLVEEGTQTNDVIALCLPQGPDIIISLLAILKASAAYLPISADIPDARIKNILLQSQATVLLTDSHYHLRLAELHHKLICVDTYQSATEANLKPLNNIEPTSDSLAYVLFTSGSSGQPKGVMIDHLALSTRIQWLQSLFKLSSKDRIGQTIHYTFDPSVLEIFLALSQGACLTLKPEQCQGAEQFAQFIIENKITALALVPTSVRLLLQGLPENQKTSLRIACCGGERLAAELASQFLEQTNASLLNVYGPTEATIISSAWTCEKNFSGSTLPIGLPADDTKIYIGDQNLNPLPLNVEGEIVITGSTLAQGYINQPELNKSAFSTCPQDQSRLYKTGDKGYIGYDGLLYFSGRFDRQVKISGYRIELGEIESLLQTHHSVEKAAVTTHTVNQHTSIYAYIETKEQNSDALVQELSQLLRQQLPSYMQAKKIIPLTNIITSQAGKIDYAKLPEPAPFTALNKEKSPRSRLEKQLHQLWEKVLPVNSFDIDENFFELGGDSISAISLMISIEQLANERYPLSFLLQHPTIARQAEQISNKLSATNQPMLQMLSKQTNGPTLFIAAPGAGDFIRLSNLARNLDNSCCTYMLQPPEIQDKALSIHQIAQHYADIILQNSDSNFYIAGFSIGGITALETARILTLKGHITKGLILLDSIYPRWPLSSPALFKLVKAGVKTFSLSNQILNNQKLGAMLNDPGLKLQLKALPTHKIQGVDLPVALILTKRMWMFHPLMFSSWKKLFKQHLTQYSVSGLHGEMFQSPHCEKLAVIIKKIIPS